MADNIPSLWPADIKVDVQTPLAILRVQANQLGRITKGVLAGDTETEFGEHQVQHRLVVVAPALGSRTTLITIRHEHEMPYPAEIRTVDGPAPRSPLPGKVATDAGDYVAYGDDELQAQIKEALQTSRVRSVISSLLAKSNAARPSLSEPEAPKGDG